MERFAPETARIQHFLESIRRRIRRAAGLHGVLFNAAALAGVAVLSLFLDRVFRLGVPARALLLLLYTGALALATWRLLIRPLVFPLSPRVLADLLERLQPELHDRLRSAVDFLREPAVASSGGELPAAGLELAFKRQVVLEAEASLAGLSAVPLVNRKALRAAGLAGGGALLLLALVFGLAPGGTARLWLHRNLLLGAEEWPYRTRLAVEGFESGRRGVPQGDPLEIIARAEGVIPEHAWITLLYPQDRRRFPLIAFGESSFRHGHPEVREPFRFHVEGGDFRSRLFQVEVLERPRIASLRITREFPAYTGMKPGTGEAGSGELAVPVGTVLQFEGESTKPLERAWLEAEGKEMALAVDPQNRRRFTGSFAPLQNGLLTIRWRDLEGVLPETPAQIHLQLIPDRPPAVKLKASGIGAMVSAFARLPLSIEATDDYRVEGVQLAWNVAGEEAGGRAGDASNPADAAGGQTPPPPGPAPSQEGQLVLRDLEPGPAVRGAHAFQVADLKLEPEKRLAIRAMATDNDTLNGPHLGASAALEFLVVSPEKLMDDFLRRQEEQRRAFERIIQREGAMRDALYEAIDGGLKKEGELEPALSQTFLSNAREERSIGSQSLSIAGAIEAILTEMENNRIGEAADLQRLGQKVVEPLREIAQSPIPAVAGGFESLRQSKIPAERVAAAYKLAEEMEALIKQMEAVLASMNKLEGFSEVVKRLRGVIQLQNESSEATRKAYERLLKSIFEEEGAPK